MDFSKYLLVMVTCYCLFACERDIEDLDSAQYPTTSEVFIDGFTAGLQYAAFGGSDVTAFDVDEEIRYSGNSSMKFSVPDAQDPAGAYAGGVYFTEVGRDLRGYNVLSFWARSSQPANLDLVGIGNDLGRNSYQASVSGLAVNSNWKKYYIPIPNPEKLDREKGLFFYSEGPENERGYTFWIDEVKFENLGTIRLEQAIVQEGEEVEVTAETGNTYNLSSKVVFNLPEGTNLEVNSSPAYFDYMSSDPSVASVNEEGVVEVLQAGEAVITAMLGDMEAIGSLKIVSTGAPLLPGTPAPLPTQDATDVISVYSDAYENIPVDFYNGFWEFSTTKSDFVEVGNDEVIRYSDLNFVGIQFTNPTIDVTDMTHLHIDLWTPLDIGPEEELKILLYDLGADGAFGGEDDSSHELSLTSPTLVSKNWMTLDIPLSEFVGLVSQENLAQVVLSGNVSTMFVDNLYFYRDDTQMGGGGQPSQPAPNLGYSSDDVLAVFSDQYEQIPGTDFNPNWGQSTVVTEIQVQNDRVLQYTGLNYQGIQLGASQDVSTYDYLHVDVWTANSTELNVFLISPGPTEEKYVIPVPTEGWSSIDIPISHFEPVDLTDVIQLKYDGNGTIFLDNIVFHRGSQSLTAPTTTAPIPSLEPQNVISMFSDAYEDRIVDTWLTDWSDGMLQDISVDGDEVKKYSNVNFVGIESITNPIDATGMTHVHMDVWTADANFFALKIVDFGDDAAFGGGDDVEHELGFDNLEPASWNSLDIPLSDFVNLSSRSHLAQYIISARPAGESTIYIDNFYFYK